MTFKTFYPYFNQKKIFSFEGCSSGKFSPLKEKGYLHFGNVTRAYVLCDFVAFRDSKTVPTGQRPWEKMTRGVVIWKKIIDISSNTHRARSLVFISNPKYNNWIQARAICDFGADPDIVTILKSTVSVRIAKWRAAGKFEKRIPSTNTALILQNIWYS